MADWTTPEGRIGGAKVFLSAHFREARVARALPTAARMVLRMLDDIDAILRRKAELEQELRAIRAVGAVALLYLPEECEAFAPLRAEVAKASS